jgi:hypothetical protein
MARMPILSEGELIEVETDDRRELELAGLYWQSGYQAFLDTGETDRLDQFEGLTIGGFPLETDPDIVEGFAISNPGFDPGELYES